VTILANTELSNTFNKWRLNTNVTTDRVKSITHSADNGRIVLTGNVEVNTSDFVVDTTTSRVGIGVAAPTKELDVAGEVKVSANVAVDTSVLYVDAVSDRVGVGTATPAEKLDVVGTIKGNTLTDGTISITGGNITSATGVTATTFTGDLTGNADTATKWQTGRTITLTGDVTGVSGTFDGSGDLSFATTIAADSVALGTDTTGNYVDNVTAGEGIAVTGSAGEGWEPAVALRNATNLTNNTLLKWNNSTEELTDSIITDDGSESIVAGHMKVTGIAYANTDTSTYDNETGASVTLDLSLSNNIEVGIATTSGTFTFNNPTNDDKKGQIGVIKISRLAGYGVTSIVFASDWNFMGNIPDLDADLDATGKFGYLDYYVDSATNIRVNWSGANTSA
jgi:hypothetical protein